MSRGWRSKIPDRWLDYKGIGKVIRGTPFVGFKVPLHETICENLPEYERHTTREVMEALPELGLVLDLTNTPNRTKYYQPEDWKSNGIDYRWIKTEGHVTPSESILVHFCRTVRKFMSKNPTKLIGIHCTHGLNRTGYFVCSYMVLVLRIPPQIALQTFAEARGYDIERQNYINSIFSHQTNFDLRQLTLQNSRWGADDDINATVPMPSSEILTRQFGRRHHHHNHHYQHSRGGRRSHDQNEFAWQNGVRQGGSRYENNYSHRNQYDNKYRGRRRNDYQNYSN